MFRTIWSKFLAFNPLFGIALILLFGIPRFIFVLQSNITGDFSWVSTIFLAMWILPFMLLSKKGRKAIGICKPTHWPPLFYAFVAGVLTCWVIFSIGNILYGDTIANWTVYIAQSYQLKLGSINPGDKIIYFLIFAVVSMTFSPIGEELLYRGLIHKSFATRWGENPASWIDSAAFGITHLAHFGIVYQVSGFRWLPVPSAIWILVIFLTGLLFSWFKNKSGSIWGAILCHAGFNLGLTYFIFYYII